MAKRDAKQLILETHDDFTLLQEKLASAKATRDEYTRLLKNARERLARREKDGFAESLALGFIESMKAGNIPEATLIKAIDDAADINREFDNRTYKLYLYKVANDKEIYKYFLHGSGFGINLDFQIIYEMVAGTLDDYSEGITNYRQVVLKSKGLTSEKAGQKATEWWDANVFAGPLHDKTISGRLAVTPNGQAPFWQLLNFGTTEMDSDRPGGYNTVPAVPTNFINKTELAIEKSFREFMNKEATKRFEETKEIKDIVAEHQAKRDQYSAEVSDLKTELRLNERIFKSFDEKKEFIDKDILAKAISLMDSGAKFKTRRVNIAQKGSGLEIIITLKKLEGTIEI